MKTLTFRDKGKRAKNDPFRKAEIPEGRGLYLSLFKSKIEILTK